MLRNARERNGFSVEDVAQKLISRGIERATVKTIYSWERGNSQPKPDAFLELCQIYEISDVLAVFGFQESNSVFSTQDDKQLERIICHYHGMNQEGRDELEKHANILTSSGLYSLKNDQSDMVESS